MPNRILREGILTSSRISRLNWAEECFYRRLMSVVDDFGRYFADLGLLRAACYPRQLNKVSDSDVEKWLQATEKAALVRVYPAKDGERYLEVIDFKQQVRAKASKFPDEYIGCVADAAQMLSNAHLDVSVSVSVDEGVSATSPAKPAATGFAEFWSAYPRKVGKGEAEKAWAKLKPSDDLRQTMLTALSWQTRSADWLKESGKFIPHPSTWLNGKRWEDQPTSVPARHSGFGLRDYHEGATEDGRF